MIRVGTSYLPFRRSSFLFQSVRHQMFDFFGQRRLQRQGFSSGQKRRKPATHGWVEALRSGPAACGGLFVLFAAVIAVMTIFLADGEAIFAEKPLKALVVTIVIAASLMVHLYVNLPQTLADNARVLLLQIVIVAHLLLLRLAAYMAVTFAPEGGFLLLVATYGFAPMMISLLMGRNHGTLAAIYASLLGGLMVEKSVGLIFLVFSLIGSFVALYLSHKVRRRGKLMSAGVYVGLAIALLAIGLGEIQLPFLKGGFRGGLAADWEQMGRQCLAALVAGIVTSMLVSGLLPLFEALFHVTTDISWIELTDLNHPLLKRMTIEAPGTYHHSLVVANLAEAAAEAIGANATMARVGAYFHDIGKLKKPQYCIENIGEGENPHDELTPTMSALIIMSHVKDGVDLALKYKLKREVIDVIQEHHGTSLVYFFYHRALKQRLEVEEQVRLKKAHEEDIPEVKEETFRYHGPTPRSRESAIISLADAVESASRSLQKPTPQKIEQLIDEITTARLEDGQLAEAAITFADLTEIRASFCTTLRSMMHNRIAYPKSPPTSSGNLSSVGKEKQTGAEAPASEDGETPQGSSLAAKLKTGVALKSFLHLLT